jgi:hypothetical protein
MAPQLIPESAEWNAAWAALAARLESDVDAVDAEGWQYMGTDERGHCFRQRRAGAPHRYEFIPVQS